MKLSEFENMNYNVKCPYCECNKDHYIEEKVWVASIDGETDDYGDRVWGYDGYDEAFLKVKCFKCNKIFYANHCYSNIDNTLNGLTITDPKNAKVEEIFGIRIQKMYKEYLEAERESKHELRIKKLNRFRENAKIINQIFSEVPGSKLMLNLVKSMMPKSFNNIDGKE